MSDEKALAVVAPSQMTLSKPSSPKDLLEYAESVSRLIKEGLKKGTDYGMIPGTQKETLFKAGAERLCLSFGVIQKYTIIETECDHNREIKWEKEYYDKRQGRRVKKEGTSIGLYRYVVQCELISRSNGQVLGTQAGLASTMESKYIEHPRDCENTVLKMAQKRALVGAALNSFGLSDRFAQDTEEFSTDTVDAEWEKVPEKTPPKKVNNQTAKDMMAIYQTAKDKGLPSDEWNALLKAAGQEKKGDPLTPEQIQTIKDAVEAYNATPID